MSEVPMLRQLADGVPTQSFDSQGLACPQKRQRISERLRLQRLAGRRKK